MTKFEEMNNVTTNFVSLSEQELMEMDGGAGPVLAFIIAHPYISGGIAGGVAAVGTAVVGMFRKK